MTTSRPGRWTLTSPVPKNQGNPDWKLRFLKPSATRSGETGWHFQKKGGGCLMAKPHLPVPSYIWNLLLPSQANIIRVTRVDFQIYTGNWKIRESFTIHLASLAEGRVGLGLFFCWIMKELSSDQKLSPHDIMNHGNMFLSYPRCSMYGIFTYIYPHNYPNVGK